MDSREDTTSNISSIVVWVFVAGNLFTESLPTNGCHRGTSLNPLFQLSGIMSQHETALFSKFYTV
jgi:hypothetical protein